MITSRRLNWRLLSASQKAIITSRNLTLQRWQSTVAVSHDSRVFKVSAEVTDAIATGKAVVALETTIYTHGFPYPESAALANQLEDIVRQNGAVPATIGLLEGVARVGLSGEELQRLTASGGKPETMKVSRRDLPYITGLGLAGRKLNGGTTISGTMILAEMAGIEVFGTGGLGGVHRGGQDTMDVSADLTELGRTPVTVISSGCKSFLDLPRTLEYLETQGVCVGTFRDGRTGPVDFPAFYTRDSGVRSHVTIENEQEAAAIIYARRLLGLKTGLHFANPIPEAFSIPQSAISKVIDEAVREAAEQGIHGHRNTPFILAKIKELTGDKSVEANRVLVASNVERAAKVAVELSKLKSTNQGSTFMPKSSNSLNVSSAIPQTTPTLSLTPTTIPTQPDLISLSHEPLLAQTAPDAQPSIFVAGSIAVDLSCDYAPVSQSKGTSPLPHTSNKASIQQSIGGVGHNVARAAHLASPPDTVRLCTVVADDLSGSLIMSTLKSRGMDTEGTKILPVTDTKTGDTWRTAQYVAINDAKKDLVLAMADMDIVGSAKHNFEQLWLPMLQDCEPDWTIVDGNWHPSLLKKWCKAAKSTGSNVVFEPVSVEKSTRIFPSIAELRQMGFSPDIDTVFPLHQVDLASPNEYELKAMYEAARNNDYFQSQAWWGVIDSLGIPSTGARVQMTFMTNAKLVDEGIPQQVIQLLPFIPNIITKLGSQGVLVTKLLPKDHPSLHDRDSSPYILSRCQNSSEAIGGIYMRLFPVAETVDVKDIVSVNGVGDTFLGVLVAGMARGMQLEADLIGVAQRAAVMTLKSADSVHADVGRLRADLP